MPCNLPCLAADDPNPCLPRCPRLKKLNWRAWPRLESPESIWADAPDGSEAAAAAGVRAETLHMLFVATGPDKAVQVSGARPAPMRCFWNSRDGA